MSELLDYPTEATPPDPNWTWWNGLNVAEPQRQPQRPTLVASDGLAEFASLDALADTLAARLAGRTPVLKRSVASYPGFDTFPAFSVYARAEGGQTGTAPAAVYIGCVAVQKNRADALEAAIAAAGQATRAAA